MDNYIEIHKEVFDLIAENSKPIKEIEFPNAVKVYYFNKGTRLLTVTNFYSRAVTQYFMQDINA